MSDMGEVEITLGKEKHTLRCTLKAARTVSALSGGFAAAFRGLNDYSLATYTAIVAAGLDKRGTDAANVELLVYQTGLDSLTTPLARYVNLLMNGGREPGDVVEGADVGKD
jgi:hypothetical protein